MDTFSFAKGYAQTSYERLILNQPEVEFGGLWHLDGRYYIVCPSLEEATTSEGLPLKTWFDEYCRIITCQVDLVNVAPAGATRTLARTPEQLSQLNGAPLSSSQFHLEIMRQLPKPFPHFKIDDHPSVLRIMSSTELNEESRQLIEIAIANFGIDIDVEFIIEPKVQPNVNAHEFYFADQRLKGWSSKLSAAQEEGEQRWFDDRLSLFSTEQIDSSRYIPSVTRERTACFIDCTFGLPSNIRNYLTTYSTIYLAPPMKGYQNLLQSFSVTEGELATLVSLGRVIIILSDELHLYDRVMLENLLDHDQSQFTLHRQLASATIAESRKRNPLLYPVLNNEARRDLLALLNSDVFNADLPQMQSIRKYLGSSWASLETDYSIDGARAGFQHGAGRLLAEIISHKNSVRVNPDVLVCSTSVEWGVALNANYCPVASSGLPVESIASLMASFITGVRTTPIIDTTSNLDVIVDDLLVLDGKTPIKEVIDTFSVTDVNRLNQLLKENNFNAEAVKSYVSTINEKVRILERVEKGAKRRDLLTLIGAIAPTAITGPTASWIPVAVWFIQRMLNNESRAGNEVTDWLRAKNTFTTSDAVFVSRLRKKE
jgi:hypothetical protein